MDKDQKHQHVDEYEEVGKAIGSAEAFVERNIKFFIYIVIAVIVLIAAYFWWNNGLKKDEKKAQALMFKSEQFFAQDSLQMALGTIETSGFLSVIEDYRHTPSSNLAKAYAGICYLRLGQYDEAEKYLKDFDGDDLLITPSIIGAIGDSYAEQSDYDSAIKYYKKAESHNNNIISPYFLRKQGIMLEAKGKFQNAIEIYNKIEDKYPTSRESIFISKDIARAQAQIN